MAETTRSIEVTVDLAGVDEDDFEVQLFVRDRDAWSQHVVLRAMCDARCDLAAA